MLCCARVEATAPSRDLPAGSGTSFTACLCKSVGGTKGSCWMMMAYYIGQGEIANFLLRGRNELKIDELEACGCFKG